ncbi:MAG TPA: alpha/beta hydrolase [Aquihabitans sp.]|nr:alpha/beta hydrolase [Aquihabitans sp.]
MERPARSVEGVGLHVLRFPGDGSSPAVVVVHGGMDRASSFGRVARRLADVPLVTYDRRGYGRSIDAGTTDLDGHVDDLLAVVGTEPAVVFGHSVGGVVALVAAERRPELVRAVLAFEAPAPWAHWWPQPSRRPADDAESDPGDEAERFMRRMVGDAIWERLPPGTRADRRAEGPALRADLRSIDRSSPPYDAASIAVPVLSAAGGETTWWHRRAAEELAAAVPDGRFEVLGDATHGAHLTHAAETAHLVRAARALGVTPAP